MQEKTMINYLSDQQKSELFYDLHVEIPHHWDESVAKECADIEGIELTDAHFEVLRYLRRCHNRFGQIYQTHTLTQALETRFAMSGGKKFLYTLFPKGPVTQGCDIAGIPAPKDSIDTLLGTAA